MRLGATVAVAFILGTAPAYAAGNADIGGQLAQRWCTGCHIIGNAGHGSDAAPALPPTPERDQKWLHAWLTSPHPPMPDMHLSRQEVDDLVAFLESLRGQRK